MSFKKESPARPPPPKVGKKTSNSPAMKFSFKSLEQDEDDEENLTVLTGELAKKVELDRLKTENNPNESKNRTLLEKKNEETSTRKDIGEGKKSIPTQRSWDSPSHSITSHKEESGPSRSASDNKLQKYSAKSVDEESNAISWLKQNVAEISSAVKDKAFQARKKIEEFSENIGKDEESKVKEMKTIPPEQKKSSPIKEKQQVILQSEKREEVKEPQKENISACEADTPEANLLEDSNKEKETEEFNIVDDFFKNEPSEDFTGLPSAVRTDTFPSKKGKVSLKRRLVKSKVPQLKQPVSMSRLSKDKVDEMEEATNKFFDAKDETATNKLSSSAVNEPSKFKIFTENVEKHVPIKKLIGLIGLILLYLTVPLPSYISGLIMGSFLASLGWISYIFITKPPTPKDAPKLIPLRELPPMIEPEINDVSLDDDVTVYKGWMNEIEFYNPDSYHINNTHSVHVYLDGITLRLRRPKVGIPKRAMWDEETQKSIEFVHQRYFSLEGGRVFLMPPGLVKKRIWSKKYPICIALKNTGRKQTADASETLPESDQGFEIISEECCDTSVLYIFARTCHEKEMWYKRFEAACKGNPLKRHLVEVKKFFVNRRTSKVTSSTTTHETLHQRNSSNSTDSTQQHMRQSSTDSNISLISSSSAPVIENSETTSDAFDMEEFIRYMGRTMPKDYYSKFLSPYKRNPVEAKDTSYMIDCEPQLLWLNAVISRCSWDFLHQKYWADKIMDKLQKKLDKIHIPYFIEALKITDINLGAEMPVIRRANAPFLDNQGFWVDLDVNYGGGFKMTILTKVNLMKLKKASKEDVKAQRETKERSAVTNSEEEDSAESSTDEEEEILPQGSEESQATGGKTSRKWMKYLKKITDSKYFQSATEMKYVKKAMEEVSNTPLVLTVELRFLSGILAINIPPPPTDRIWYGFRGNPKLTLVAKPKVGERRVTVSHITEFIEKKLAIEFQRVLVMPNLDDLVIPLLIPEYKDPVPDTPKIARTSSSLSSPV